MKIIAARLQGPHEVEAEEAFEMYGYRWMVYNDPEKTLHGDFDDWYVIEFHTGRSANRYGQFTKEQAIASSKERIKQVGEKRAVKIIKKYEILNQ